MYRTCFVADNLTPSVICYLEDDRRKLVKQKVMFSQFLQFLIFVFQSCITLVLLCLLPTNNRG